MASKPNAPMPAVERAKQFLPFAALKGLQEALERKEYDGKAQKEIAGPQPDNPVDRRSAAGMNDMFTAR